MYFVFIKKVKILKSFISLTFRLNKIKKECLSLEPKFLYLGIFRLAYEIKIIPTFEATSKVSCKIKNT